MASTWSKLANGVRWRGVVSFIRNWVGPFDSHQGMPPKELDKILRAKSLNLPTAVREWYVLAANWNQGGIGVWIYPRDLAACDEDEMVWILTDTEGITQWGVRVADLDAEDPPVYSLAAGTDEIEFPTFTSFVGAMIVNDLLFADNREEPVELDPDSARAALQCLVSARCGDFYADAPLESATVVMFIYPDGAAAYGKSRTPAGRALLEQLE
jgi:hypothetical protein